jgi:2-keto-4-pentenoate hydratase/2-oxohepta-3-ene-1,7-dioic acid hydratase in catechol pathway
VGHTSGTYLAPGDRIEATIEGIGTLVSPVIAEPSGRAPAGS